MKKLYLVRHGIAETTSPTGQDAGRRLTDEGTRRIGVLAAFLHRCGVLPDVVVASPYVRAQQTAELLTRGMGFTGAIDTDRRLIPAASVRDVQSFVTEYRSADELMLVGHEPWMSGAAATLLASGSLGIIFQPGSVCCIGIERSYPAGGSLLWFLPPDLLQL